MIQDIPENFKGVSVILPVTKQLYLMRLDERCSQVLIPALKKVSMKKNINKIVTVQPTPTLRRAYALTRSLRRSFAHFQAPRSSDLGRPDSYESINLSAQFWWLNHTLSDTEKSRKYIKAQIKDVHRRKSGSENKAGVAVAFCTIVAALYILGDICPMTVDIYLA